MQVTEAFYKWLNGEMGATHMSCPEQLQGTCGNGNLEKEGSSRHQAMTNQCSSNPHIIG